MVPDDFSLAEVKTAGTGVSGTELPLPMACVGTSATREAMAILLKIESLIIGGLSYQR
jgi:hypothetical protein